MQILDIDDEFTKPRKISKGNLSRLNVVPVEDYNIQADLLFLPETKKYKYLLTVVDIASNECEFEPLKNKNSSTVLNAIKTIFKRGIIKEPKYTIMTDSGTEFKSEFHEYFFKRNIWHKIALPGRHKQQVFVERLNYTLGLLIFGYLNSVMMKKGKPFNDWVSFLPKLREILNNKKNGRIKETMTKKQYINDYVHEVSEPPLIKTVKNKKIVYTQEKPYYKVGDLVHYKLDYPEDVFNLKLGGQKFRAGDYRFSRESHPITKVLNFNSEPYFRYLVKSRPGVSYSKDELLKSKEITEKFKPLKIMDRKKINGITHYKIRWKNQKASSDTWEPENNLIEDGQEEFINYYNENINPIKKTTKKNTNKKTVDKSNNLIEKPIYKINLRDDGIRKSQRLRLRK